MKAKKEDNVVIFGMENSQKLAQEIGKYLNKEILPVKTTVFADGECLLKSETTVRNKDVYIICNTSKPVNDNIMSLLILIDSLRRSSAKSINCVMTYYGYARQDRKARSREPITAKLVANLIETAGADRVIAIDLHALQIQGFFNIPVDHLMCVPIIAKYFANKLDNMDDVVVVSPDHGGVTRARKLADKLNTPIAIIDKRRPKPNVAEVMNIVGNIQGKTCILIDDIIDTAGTITLGAKALLKQGAKEVYASCSHAVLSGPALERLENSPIKELVYADTINIPENKKIGKMVPLSTGELLGKAIYRIHKHESVSDLFE